MVEHVKSAAQIVTEAISIHLDAEDMDILDIERT